MKTEFSAFVTKTEIETVKLYEIMDMLLRDTTEFYIVGQQCTVADYDEHFLP